MRITIAASIVAIAVTMPQAVFAAAPVQVVAAENFYGDLAMQIGGSHVAVTSILSNPDDDPHLFESNASTAKAIAGAQIVIYNGADYDAWMDKLLSASKKPKRLEIVAAAVTGHKSGDNPHLWYDPATLPKMALAFEAELEKRDPSHAADFRKNLDAFNASFAKVAEQVAAIRSKHSGLKVTATEPVFGYMAGALGFTMLNYEFQVATMNNTEPSASQVAAFEKSLKEGEAKIMFYNSQVTDKTTERLLAMAKTAHIAVVGVTETEPKGKTIQTWFGGQLDEISKDLPAKP